MTAFGNRNRDIPGRFKMRIQPDLGAIWNGCALHPAIAADVNAFHTIMLQAPAGPVECDLITLPRRKGIEGI